MQNDSPPDANGCTITTTSTATATTAYTSPLDPYMSFSSQPVNYYHEYYAASNFPPKSPFPTSLSITPSSDDHQNTINHAVATESRLYQARLILEHQQLRDRYDLCFAHLQDILQESESLRRENAELRLANRDLINRLSLLSQATIENCLLSSSHTNLLSDFRRLSIGGGLHDRHVSDDSSDFSPTSVIEHNNRFETRNAERISLPKSISVRSKGYLKMTQPQPVGNSGDPTHAPSRQRVTSPLSEAQRVYVPGSKRDKEEAMEFDVFNQGMFKTELCNKWQETGTCPYRDNCQFAHGITELRPVIRHPRYKTEVCRMVLGGGTCPYGHRCHFRHSLTDQERLLGPHHA